MHVLCKQGLQEVYLQVLLRQQPLKGAEADLNCRRADCGHRLSYAGILPELQNVQERQNESVRENPELDREGGDGC